MPVKNPDTVYMFSLRSFFYKYFDSNVLDGKTFKLNFYVMVLSKLPLKVSGNWFLFFYAISDGQISG